MAKGHLVFFAVILATIMLAQPVSAAALTSVVTDPSGDAFLGGAPSRPGEPFQDILQTAITLKKGVFTFEMDLAAPIPDSPSLHGGNGRLLWQWTLDTDPATFPAGFPYAPSDARPAEFFALLLWDGTRFTGIVIDRRPLLIGAEATITPVPFTIKGAEVTLSVDSAILGNPPSFGWFSVTRDWFGPLGTEAEFVADSAPDFPPGSPPPWVAWPPP